MAENQYAVHDDFKKFPVFNFRYNRLFIGFVNLFLGIERFLSQRKTLALALRHDVASADGETVRVFQFNPRAANTLQSGTVNPLPAVLYFHGGAFVMTYASSHVAIADYYAQQAQCIAFLVDYRLAHTNPYPEGFNDCYAVLKWVKDNAARLGVDPDRIVVAGDSAGGGLAAAAAQRALDEEELELLGQLLVYPTLDSGCKTQSGIEYHNTPMWNAVSNLGMWKTYLQNVPPGDVPEYASPAKRGDLSRLPTSYVETAEFDPLCDEGVEYANRLRASGVAVTLNQTTGTVHGYDAILSSEITQTSLRKRIDFLKALFI